MGRLRLSATQHEAVHAIVAQLDDEVANERSRWGEERARRVAARGTDPALIVKARRTLASSVG